MGQKIMYRSLVSFLLLFSSGLALAQSHGPSEAYNSSLASSFHEEVFQRSQIDSLITWQERVILHVDKPFLTKDTPLFFKAYALTGPNRVRATLSKVLRVELVDSDGAVAYKQYHKIENGMSSGAISIPKKMDDGAYTLRAYTRWMQNYGDSFYFKKELQLGATKKNIKESRKTTQRRSVSFHPEGGTLIEKFSNRLLIKVHDNQTRMVEMEGKILDSKKNTVATIVPYSEDIMSVIFTPIPGERYTLQTNLGHSYSLPEVESKGCLLTVNNLDVSSLRMQVRASSNFLETKMLLKGEMGGITYFERELVLLDSAIDIAVPKTNIPFGVLTVSLVDEQGTIWSERPVSIEPNKGLQFEIEPLVGEETATERAFKVKVVDAKGKPVATEFSLSVTNVDQGNALKMAAESKLLDPKVDALHKLDVSYDRKERFSTDLDLLTAEVGMDESVSQNVPDRITYPFQEGLDLFGYAYNLNNELLKNTKIQMMGSSDADVVVRELETDAAGRIRLENLQIVGKTSLVFRTVADESASRVVKVIPFQEEKYNNPKSNGVLGFGNSKKGKVVGTSPWQAVKEDRLIELEEVEVMEKKLKKKEKPAVYGMVPSKVMYQDPDKPKTIPQLFLGVAGVQIRGLGTLEPQVILPRASGIGPILWVLDGLPLMQPSSLADIMSIVNAFDIERIEILFGPQAAIYGTRAAGGAILVYTRSASDLDYVNRKEGRLNFQGYFESPSFDSYLGKVAKNSKKATNKISTIYWNPAIKTNAKGEAVIRFEVPNGYDQLELKAKGVTKEGALGAARILF